MSDVDEWFRRRVRRAAARRERVRYMANRLYVGNLPYSVGEEDLRSLFGQVGTVEEVHLPIDRQTGRPRGFAFVQFASDEQAQEAIQQLDGYALDGRQIRVSVAQDREASTRGPARRRY